MYGLGDRLITSESLSDRMPDISGVIEQEEETFYVCTVALRRGPEVELLSGRTMYFSKGSQITVELRTGLSESFALLKACLSGELMCDGVYLSFGEDVLEVKGPFDILAPRVADFDMQEKTCTLGLDMRNRT